MSLSNKHLYVILRSITYRCLTIFNWSNRYDFFISYCQNDGSNYANALRDELDKRGYKCFIDKINVTESLILKYPEMGQSWKGFPNKEGSLRKFLAQSLKKTHVLIFLASDGAFLSRWVQYELENFGGKNILIPISAGNSLGTNLKFLPNIDHLPQFKKLYTHLHIVEERERFNQGSPDSKVIDTIEKSYSGYSGRCWLK